MNNVNYDNKDKIGDKPNNKAFTEPRIWLGRTTDVYFWKWHNNEWTHEGAGSSNLTNGDVFMLGAQKPSCTPADFFRLEVCDEIDWLHNEECYEKVA